MRTRNWMMLLGGVFLVLVVWSFRPVPIQEEKDCLSLKGRVSEVYDAGVKDVVFRLHGQDKLFYINRGLEKGLDLMKLKSELMNKEIVIKYPQYWTPLDPVNSIRHISKLEHAGRTIYSELKE